jgi:hypothetical protein
MTSQIGRRRTLRMGGACLSIAAPGKGYAGPPAGAPPGGLRTGGSGEAPERSLLPPGVTPSPISGRRVGVCYSTWHLNKGWDQQKGPNSPWGKPVLGYYASDDPDVIRKHAEWLNAAGVDFLLVDWSNDLGVDPATGRGTADKLFLEGATVKMLDVFAKLPKSPNISILLGDFHVFDDDHQQLQRKADQVYGIASDPRYSARVETYLGKPLLVVFVGDQPQARKPTWDDSRFTVRYMTAFVTSRSNAFHAGPVSTLGFWSWEDFGAPSFPIYEGYPEVANAVAAYRGDGSKGRQGGQTFVTNWLEIRRIGPRFALSGTFNEWWVAEQHSPEQSKDIEPSEEFGSRYLDILRVQAAMFKQGK